MFIPNSMLDTALKLERKERDYIIGALIGYLNEDLKFKTNNFENAINYVLENGISEEVLFHEFDEELEMHDDCLKWNDEYFSRARLYLKSNFCRERIEHLKSIVNYNKIKMDLNIKKVYNEDDKKESRKANVKSKKMIIAGLALVSICFIGKIILSKKI